MLDLQVVVGQNSHCEQAKGWASEHLPGWAGRRQKQCEPAQANLWATPGPDSHPVLGLGEGRRGPRDIRRQQNGTLGATQTSPSMAASKRLRCYNCVWHHLWGAFKKKGRGFRGSQHTDPIFTWTHVWKWLVHWQNHNIWDVLSQGTPSLCICAFVERHS